MLLTVGVIGVVVVVLGCAVFLGLAEPEAPQEQVREQPERRRETPRQVFFLAPLQQREPLSARVEPSQGLQVPIEVLLNDLEEHVRAENSAAEEFARAPSVTSLHHPSQSKFLN